MSRGVRSHWRAGAAAGFLGGAAATFALLNRGGSTNPCDASTNQVARGLGACVGVAALGGVAGSGLGALIGKAFQTENWRSVPTDRVRVSLGPQPGIKFRVAVTLTF